MNQDKYRVYPSLRHAFYVNVALQTSVCSAIIFSTVLYQVQRPFKSVAYKGRRWFVCPFEECEDLFPEFSADEIRSAVNSLVKEGYIDILFPDPDDTAICYMSPTKEAFLAYREL